MTMVLWKAAPARVAGPTTWSSQEAAVAGWPLKAGLAIVAGVVKTLVVAAPINRHGAMVMLGGRGGGGGGGGGGALEVDDAVSHVAWARRLLHAVAAQAVLVDPGHGLGRA